MDNKFTMKLAYYDMIPVLLFGIGFGILGMKLKSILFVIGIIICTLSGVGKVLWKVILALKNKEVTFLFYQLRYVMPVGFLVLIIGAVMAEKSIRKQLLQQALQFPSIVCFALGILGMVIMFILAFKIDKHDVKGNWTEQGVNTIAQALFLAGILFL